jgi:RsiW-degrading membrane proteinase PrsW (M82 family)
MFKKNKMLSIVGFTFAMTIGVWWDKPWQEGSSIGQQTVMVISIVSGILTIYYLAKALRDGTYGE